MKKLLLIKLALVLAVLSFGVVQAISYYFPNPNSDSNSNKIAAIAYPGSGYALDAPRAEFKLFMVDKTGNNITINNGCNTSSWGWGNDSTIFELYQNNSSEESVGGPISSKNSWANCTGNDVTFNNISANTKSSVQGREQYYTMTLVARKSNTSGGINGFQVILNNQKNFVSFKELYPSSLVTNTTQPPDKSFSLISKQFSSNPSGENSYHMEFKADCSVTSNLRIYLKWFDADHGRSNDKGTAINFNLYDQTAGSQVTMTAYDGSPETTITGNNIGGQGDYRYARFTIKPDHQYIWRWNGVDNNNGIQLWMPFTETNWNISCGTYDYQPRINIVSDAEVTNGDLITPRLRIRNLTSFDGQLYHGDVISRDNSDNIEYTSSPSPTSGYSEWGNKNYRWTNPSGVSSSDGWQFYSAQYRVTDSTQLEDDRINICFRGRVTPDAGPIGTMQGSEFHGDECVVYYRPYDFTLPSGSIGNGKPGEESPVISFCNNGTGPSPEDNPYTITRGSNTLDSGRIDSVQAGNCEDITFTIPNNAPVGTYCFDIRLDYGIGKVFNAPGTDYANDAARTSTACINIAEQPFVTFEGNDVWAGGAWDISGYNKSWCSVENATDRFIRGVIDGVNGAFSEYAAYALGVISNFHTDTLSNDLTFRNVPDTDNTRGFYHSNQGICLTDYYNLLDKSGSGVSSVSNFRQVMNQGSGQYFWDVGGPGNEATINLNDSNFAGSPNYRADLGEEQITLIVNGDVRIHTGNNSSNTAGIRYGTNGNYSVGNPNNIPVFILVASGDIDIEADIRYLEGLYISQGDNGIDTCSDGPARLKLTDCEERLTIYGAFVATDIQFRRTRGGIIRGPVAEQFIFSPELYLSNPFLISSQLTDLRSLLNKDLPPIY